MRPAPAESSVIGIGGPDAVPKYANIKEATSGANTVVTGVSGKKIRVVSAWWVAAGTVVMYWVDGAANKLGGDDTTGVALVANSGVSLNFNPVGWFETASGQDLDINLDGNVGVAGSLTYIEV